MKSDYKKAKLIALVGLYTFRWYGGHMVHIYQHRQEIDVFNVGGMTIDEPTTKEILKGIEHWVEFAYNIKIKLVQYRGRYHGRK